MLKGLKGYIRFLVIWRLKNHKDNYLLSNFKREFWNSDHEIDAEAPADIVKAGKNMDGIQQVAEDVDDLCPFLHHL